jgi:NAD+ synthase (glutamine-hydrolysing)
MPYEVLDAIERAAIRDKRSPSEVLTLILDPKTWCRFPILSGGFTRELRELRETLAREKT